MTLPANAAQLKALFGVKATDFIPSGDSAPEVEEIVSAILCKDHALSAEQLLAFETLLDAPDVDPGERQELLQAIWNVVVCFIDYQWEQARLSGEASANACGSIADTSDQTAGNELDLVEYGQSRIAGERGETAAQEPGQKGCHDG